MQKDSAFSRRRFLTGVATVAAGVAVSGNVLAADVPAGPAAESPGSQRLGLDALKKWEALNYGMFIHYGMSTFVGAELPSGKDPSSVYAPTALDVGQWVSVARDAGMKYAILTTKHVAGHCLWPTKFTDYSVANSPDKTDVVEKFVAACREKGVLPGFYYCSWDNHNRFGSRTWSDGQDHYTTSTYQTFQTAQVTELLTQYGPVAEMWIDIPGALGRGYRTFLYNHIASLQPDAVIMMNSGISTQETYNVEYAWPSDIIAIERSLPPESGYRKYREIEGKTYYMPGEMCDPIGKEWFWVEGDLPRDDQSLLDQFRAAQAHDVNLLLDVPPDRRGLIPQESVDALMRLRKSATL